MILALLLLASEIAIPTTSPVGFMMLAKNGRVAAGTCRDHKIRVWALPEVRLKLRYLANGLAAGRTGQLTKKAISSTCFANHLPASTSAQLRGV